MTLHSTLLLADADHDALVTTQRSPFNPTVAPSLSMHAMDAGHNYLSTTSYAIAPADGGTKVVDPMEDAESD